MPKKIILRGVHFDFDKSNIKPEFVPVLEEGADTLKANPNVRVLIEGHCDWIGSRRYNYGLGLRRANSVRRFLVEHGVAADRLDVKSYGKDRPIADNKTREGRAMNRRAELHVLGQ